MRHQRLLLCVAVVIFVFCCLAPPVEGDIWQKWSSRAYKMCIKMVQRAKQSEGKCDNIEEVIDEALHSLASSMASVMHEKTPQQLREDLVHNSLKMPYRAQGERIMKETVHWIVKNDIKSEKKIREEFSKRFGQWFLNLAVDSNASNPYAGMSLEEIQAAFKENEGGDAKPKEEKPMDPTEFDKLPIEV